MEPIHCSRLTVSMHMEWTNRKSNPSTKHLSRAAWALLLQVVPVAPMMLLLTVSVLEGFMNNFPGSLY